MSYVAQVLSTDFDVKHYGIPGMRWGRRRTDAQLATAAATAKTAGASDDAINKATIDGKIRGGGVGSLSNKEIRDIIERVNLERQYSQLFPPAKTRKEKLTEFAIDTLTKEASRQVKESLNLVTTKKRNDYLRSRDLIEVKGDKKKDKGGDSPKASDSILKDPKPKKEKKKKEPDPFKVNPESVNFKSRNVPPRRNDDFVYNITNLPR